MLDNNNLIILLLFIFICFIVISNRIRQQDDNNYITQEPFDSKAKGIKFKATNTGYGKIVSIDDNGNLNSFEFPKGIIVAWSGEITKIPDGWTLCNGSNGAPDLRGRFILGANPNTGGNTNFMVNEMNAIGGEEKVQLKVEELPKHSHSINVCEDVKSGRWGGGSWGNCRNKNTDITGNDIPHNNMPPYYSLAYIMKL